MPKRISVTYLPEPSPERVIFRPKVPIWISYGGKHSYLFHALVDSGSDRNLFPAELGEIVGADIVSGKKSFIYGIGEAKLVAYEHEVNLHFGRSVFEAVVDFSYEQSMPLLGRQGFFDLFKGVDFKERKKTVDFKT